MKGFIFPVLAALLAGMLQATALPVLQEPPKTPAQTLLSEMTTEEKVGQRFLALMPEVQAAEKAAACRLGGYLLFGQDFQYRTPDQLRELLWAVEQNAAIPMLFGVDEEGGTVVRASRYPAYRDKPFASPQKVCAAGGLEGLRADAEEKGRFLADLGLNVNLAPVCDLSQNPKDFIYKRSLGLSPEETAMGVAAMVEGHTAGGVGSVLKHFPGYGNNVDTHGKIAVDKRPLSQFEQEDFLPFQAGMEAGAGAVLVSHNIVECLDPEYPASLSPAAYGKLRELGFQGVALTDDLVMDAISKKYGVGEAAVLAVNAGADMLCSSQFEQQYYAVLEAVQSGDISQKRLDEAVLRVLNWKMQLGLLGAGPAAKPQE